MNTHAAAPRENPHSVRQALRPRYRPGCLPGGRLLSFLCCLALLSGAACGQRGPLYLPAQEPPASAAPAATAPSDATPDEADDPEDQNATDKNAKDENADETGRN